MKKTALFLLLILSVQGVFACKCADPPSLTIAYCKKFDIVFLGKVDSVGACDKTATAFVNISKLYHGSDEQFVVPVNFDCATSCQMSIQKGEEWIFYGRKNDSGTYSVMMCDRNRKHFKNAEEDYYAITSQFTFDQEVEFLETQVGVKDIGSNGNVNYGKDITQREVLQTSMRNKILLLVISCIIFLAIIFFVKRMK